MAFPGTDCRARFRADWAILVTLLRKQNGKNVQVSVLLKIVRNSGETVSLGHVSRLAAN